MEDIKTQKKSRFQKGSEEAKEFMAQLRSKRGGKTPTPTPAPSPAPSPEPLPIPEPPPVAEPKKRSKKNIIVDFS